MGQATGIAGMGNNDGGIEVLKQMSEFASAFGINLPDMQRERMDLAREIAEAKDEATAARHQQELDRLEMQFTKIQEAYESQGSDPVKNAVDQVTSQIVLQRLQPNAVEQAVNESMAEKVKEMLNPAAGGGVLGEVAKAAQTMKDVKELASVLFPPAATPAAAAGMDAQQEYDLASKRIEMEERLEQRKQDKEMAVQTAKANSYQEVGKIVSAGIESIGKVLGEQMGLVSPASTSPQATPAAQTQINPAAADVQKIECPDCHQAAIYVTPEMVDQSKTQTLDIVCTSCGNHHTMGPEGAEGREPAHAEGESITASTETQSQRDRRERQERRDTKGRQTKPNRNRVNPDTGQELPRFVAQAGGGWD